jgi:hypothetical protein
MVAALEAHIDDFIDRIEMPTEFVVPGANRASAALDLARTVVRRAERLAVADSVEGSLVGRTSTGSPTCCGPWPAGPRATTTCWPGRAPRRRGPPQRITGPGTRAEGGSIVMHIEVVFPTRCPRGWWRSGSRSSPTTGPVIATDPRPWWPRGTRRPWTPVVQAARLHRQGRPDPVVRAAPGSITRPGDGLRPDVVVVGMGESSPALSGTVGLESLRRASAAFVRAVGRGSAAAPPPARGDRSALSMEWPRPWPREPCWPPTAMTTTAPARRPNDWSPGHRPADGLRRSHLAATGAAGGARLAESVSLARDLVNEPPSALTPEIFADTFVRRFADVDELTVEVWDEDRIVEEKLGGLLGVARGSTQPPRLVRVEYAPDPIEIDGRVPHLALVGKGITFDSGGLSLKTAGGMETMKTDMGGAAAVLGAVDAAAALGAADPDHRLTPLTENMPGGSAIKPGDVLTTRNGKTIEVLNTDAEGRLVLSDGLTLAVESEPDAIIDLATLTGAAVVALGKEIAGLLGNDDGLIGRGARGRRAGPVSRTGPSPARRLPEPHRLRGGRHAQCGPSGPGREHRRGHAAARVRGDVPWAHLDIAGPARSDENSRYLTKGGTGFGVRTLVALITSEEFARTLVTLGSD